MRVIAECSWWERTGEMTPFDKRGISSPIFRNLTTGEVTSDLPMGALFCADRRGREDKNDYLRAGYDGNAVVAVIPYLDGTTYFYIEGRAINCTRKDDPDHRCWVRHGTVGERVTVDKNGNTCAAGAGSIVTPGFHGFIKDHRIVTC